MHSEDRAILIVDMIPGIINVPGRVRDVLELEQQILAIENVLIFGEERGIPIFFAEFIQRYNLGSTIPELSRHVKHPRLIYKRDSSAFILTELHPELSELRTRTIALAGINTSACLQSTAEHGKKLGYDIVTSLDLMSDFEFEPLLESGPWKNSELQYFYENTCLYHSHQEVISHLQRSTAFQRFSFHKDCIVGFDV